MTERDYKIVIGVLLAINVICLIIIFVLCGEINSLQEKLSEMTDTVRALDDKISRIELAQEETLLSEKRLEKGNGYILGGALTVIGIIALIYFGGIDPGALGRALNLSADQSTIDFVSQNKLISENLKLCLSSIDFMNRSILTEVTSRTDYICKKLDVILNSIITKDVNLNSIFSNLTSGRSNWE
jgi:uncharacterized protein YoxC